LVPPFLYLFVNGRQGLLYILVHSRGTPGGSQPGIGYGFPWGIDSGVVVKRERVGKLVRAQVPPSGTI